MRHLISGIDCAMAGEATAVAAVPTAETFKKSRRFIKASPSGHFPKISPGLFNQQAARAGPLTWKSAWRKRDKGMNALIKRKSHGSERISGTDFEVREIQSSTQAAAITALS
jgi:hypothetical protein